MTDEEVKSKAEAVLFSCGKSIAQEELARLCRVREPQELVAALRELQKDYDERNSALIVVQDNDRWKMTVREKYMNVAKRIVVDTELPKSVIETLAVIAWKQPMLQSEVIKVRTNKAYDHIQQLEELGFLARKRHGRSRMIRLTEKFFKYFELGSGKDIRELFRKVKTEKDAEKKAAEFAEAYAQEGASEGEAQQDEEKSKKEEGTTMEEQEKQEQTETDTTEEAEENKPEEEEKKEAGQNEEPADEPEEEAKEATKKEKRAGDIEDSDEDYSDDEEDDESVRS